MAGRPSSSLAVLVVLVVLALFLLPWLAGQYPIYLAIQILILAVFSLGFNLLFGYTGLLSFGQAGFFAVGAYGCAKILLVVQTCSSDSRAALRRPGWQLWFSGSCPSATRASTSPC
jgi:ABC-type branched-subunit amino acid transport system permease subunit